MKYIVRIDKNSIKENPTAGNNSYFVPGPTISDGKGGFTREVTRMYCMTPEPNYLFEYLPCVVTCEYCNESFSYEDLESYDYDDYCDKCGHHNVCTAYQVCPKCKIPDCCELEYEKLGSDGKVQ